MNQALRNEWREIIMKKLLRGILMVCLMVGFMVGCAGMQPATETRIEKVIQVQGHKKDFIYDSVRMWIAEYFKSAKRVIEYEDKKTGTIIGNGTIKYPCQGIECMAEGVQNWITLFTMRVDVKDDKFRITFMNLNYSSGSWERPITKSALAAIKPKLLSFGDEIKLYVEQNSSKKDW